MSVQEVLSNLRFVYDWVSICFKKHTVAEIIALLGLEKLNFQEIKGMHGYRDRLYCDCISIHYNGRDDMGVWLEMSGKGCRIFEKFGNGDYDTLLAMAVNPESAMHLTRLDVALDDFEGLLDMRTLYYDVFDIDESGVTMLKNVVTRFHEDSFDAHAAGKGLTINFGSKSSDIFIRIYDKDAEQGRVEGRHWIRVEIQLRRERAQGFVKMGESIPSIGKRFRGVLANYVRFVTPTEDSNKRRWPTAKYWDKLLMAAEAISIYEKPAIEYTLENLESFVVKQAGNAIDAYITIRGIEGFVDAIKERGTMRNPKYDNLIESLKKPVVIYEPTPDEIYASGLDFVYYKDFSVNYQIRDHYGYRWVKCEECGEIKRSDEFARWGGRRPNYGVCRDCAKDMKK